nr:hypothetical protein [Desulfobulbaceae bacterium]
MTSKSYSIFKILLIGTIILNPFSAFSQEENKEASASNQAEVAQKKLVRVSTLNSVEANQEFQRNVQVLQAHRQRAMQLQYQLEQAESQSLKESLQEELDLALKTLAESNKKMTEAYGFSLTRDYVLVVEKAHVYMAVSAEELVEIEKERAQKAEENQ